MMAILDKQKLELLLPLREVYSTCLFKALQAKSFKVRELIVGGTKFEGLELPKQQQLHFQIALLSKQMMA